MDSITKSFGKWQPLEEKPILVYPSGVKVPKRGSVFVPDCLRSGNRRQRGQIKSFTTHSRQRLRTAMLTKIIPNTLRVGTTFTVPWKGSDFTPLMDEFRECLHRFRNAFIRRFPHSGMIYRVELQQRGAPHFHALSYIAKSDLTAGLATAGTPAVPPSAGWAVLGAMLQSALSDLWLHSVPNLYHGSYMAFMRRGVLVEQISNDGAMMRYICDHTSKHKQAQLGYKGKQWGIIGRQNFVVLDGESLPDFKNDYHAVVFFRTLRKVMRYRITAKNHHWKRCPVFGSVLKGSRRNVGDFYLSRDTVFKMWQYAANVPRGTFVKQMLDN